MTMVTKGHEVESRFPWAKRILLEETLLTEYSKESSIDSLKKQRIFFHNLSKENLICRSDKHEFCLHFRHIIHHDK